MHAALALLPDFALIALGLALRTKANWGDGFWSSLEKLVYYIIFPCLLFTTIARAPLDLAATMPVLSVGCIASVTAMAMAWLGMAFTQQPRLRYLSAAQVAFRSSAYIAFALGARLGGEVGVTQMAVLLAITVPVTNIFAVVLMAREAPSTEGPLWRQLATHPLIVSTVAGLAFNLLKLDLPAPAWAFLTRLANASLALGLITVGAGLVAPAAAGVWQRPVSLMVAVLGIKHLLMPLTALAAAWALAFPLAQVKMAVLFAALPTASAVYVFAVRMGGDGKLTAELATASVLLGMVTLPVWVALLF